MPPKKAKGTPSRRGRKSKVGNDGEEVITDSAASVEVTSGEKEDDKVASEESEVLKENEEEGIKVSENASDKKVEENVEVAEITTDENVKDIEISTTEAEVNEKEEASVEVDEKEKDNEKDKASVEVEEKEEDNEKEEGDKTKDINVKNIEELESDGLILEEKDEIKSDTKNVEKEVNEENNIIVDEEEEMESVPESDEEIDQDNKDKKDNQEKEKTGEGNDTASGIEIDADNFEPDFEVEDKDTSNKVDEDDIVMNIDDDEEIQFLEEVDKSAEKNKQIKRTLAEELVTCLICHEVCNRGVTVKCCGAQACRACAMKKVLGDKLCWVCPKTVTTQDLQNDDDIRETVQLLKSPDTEIPDENIRKLKARHFRIDKAKKAEKEKAKKKDKKSFKKIIAPEDEGEKEDNDPKSIEFKDAKKLFFSLEVVFYCGEKVVTQIGYTTGKETVLTPIVPKHDFIECLQTEKGLKVANKTHYSNLKYGDKGFILGADFESENGEMKRCFNIKQTIKKLENFLEKYGKCIFVFYSHMEHYAFTLLLKDNKGLVKHALGAVVYEEYVENTGKEFKPVNMLASLKAGWKRLYCTDRLSECVAQVVNKTKDGKNCTIKKDILKAKEPSVPEWGVFIYSSLLIESKRFQGKQKAITRSIDRKGQYGSSVVRFVCWEFNFPILVKLFNIGKTTTSIDYQGHFSNYTCQGISKVIRDKGNSYALVPMKLKTAINQQKPKVKAAKPGLDVIDHKSAVISFTENSGLEDTEEEMAAIKCNLFPVGSVEIHIQGATSILVNIVPCSDESSLGDSISFGLDDVFVLGTPERKHAGVVILNSIFTVVEEGKNMARILTCSKTPLTLNSGEPFATAFTYVKKNFPLLLKKILKEPDCMDRNIPNIVKPKELFTAKSSRGGVKDRLSLPQNNGDNFSNFKRKNLEGRQFDNNMMNMNNMPGNNMNMGANMNNMNMEGNMMNNMGDNMNMMNIMGGNMNDMGGNMGSDMNMMNPLMNMMNSFDSSLLHQQQEMNAMMSNQGSMERMQPTSRKRDYPSRNDSYDNPAKKPYSQQYEAPAKKPYSQHSYADSRDKPYSQHSIADSRERRKSGERSTRFGDAEGGFRGRDAPRRESPIGRSSNTLGTSAAPTGRRKEDIDDEIAKYEKELLLLKRMKELKEERRRALNDDRASSRDDLTRYGAPARPDSTRGGGAYGREPSLDRDRYDLDRNRYGGMTRGRSPVGDFSASKYGVGAASRSMNPMMGSSTRAPYVEKSYHGSSTGDKFDTFNSGRDKFDTYSSTGDKFDTFNSGRDKFDTYSSTRDKLDSWTPLSGARPAEGSSNRYASVLSSGNGAKSYIPTGLTGSGSVGGRGGSSYGTSGFNQSNNSNRGSQYGNSERFENRRWN